MPIVGKAVAGTPLLTAISDATAEQWHVKTGKTAYIVGGKVTGTAYTPAMMQYDGSTGFYDAASLTTAGNKTTLVARFSRAAFTGGTQEFISRIDGATLITRGQLFLSANDHATSDYQGKLQFTVKNSAGTIILRLLSINNIIDGNPHTVFAAYDGDAGTAIFYIDGVNADDTGNASRTGPTVQTLATGTGGAFVGSAATPVILPLNGQIGFMGYREAYLTNWSDFMQADGSPKQLDETTWAEWGAQPLLWNEAGDMVNNLGSAGALTKTGTINVGKGGNT